MLESIDRRKWRWNNFPPSWKGQYERKEKKAKMTLGVFSDHTLWIWQASFGLPSSLNEIIVLDASSLMNKKAYGDYQPPVEYKMGSVETIVPLGWPMVSTRTSQSLSIAFRIPRCRKKNCLQRFKRSIVRT